ASALAACSGPTATPVAAAPAPLVASARPVVELAAPPAPCAAASAPEVVEPEPELEPELASTPATAEPSASATDLGGPAGQLTIPGLPPELLAQLLKDPKLLAQLQIMFPTGMLPPGLFPPGLVPPGVVPSAASKPVPGAPPLPPLPPTPPGAGLLPLPGPVLFDTGRATLRPESDAVLTVALAKLRARADITLLRIEVHSDSMGSEVMNQSLTEQRSLSVARWLVAHGTACRRLLPVGFGETRPIADNATEAGRAQNRRTELHVAALHGRPVGGMPIDGGGKVAGDPCRP
ncbi:MAG: OmpA family protein, partial [Myxococcales bacterium]|nr:OmpA family protein [Myxococcales bacterium]